MTESELVAVDDMLQQILWMQCFLKVQGHEVQEKIIHQDNKSAILLKLHGKGSSSYQTKHIKIKYFFKKTRWTKVRYLSNTVLQI